MFDLTKIIVTDMSINFFSVKSPQSMRRPYNLSSVRFDFIQMFNSDESKSLVINEFSCNSIHSVAQLFAKLLR